MLAKPCGPWRVEPDPSRQAGTGVSIVLIDRRPLTRQCLSRWLQEGSPDLHVVSFGSPVDLLDASRSLSEPSTIIFSIGAAAVRDPEVLGKITLLRRHMSRIPLVLLSDRDDVDDIVVAMEHGVRGYIPTSLEPPEAAAALQCVAAGGTFVPASAVIKFAQDRQNGAGPSTEHDECAQAPHAARERGPGAPASGQAEQDHRARARDHREHRQGLRAADPVEAARVEPHRGGVPDACSGRLGRSRVTGCRFRTIASPC